MNNKYIYKVDANKIFASGPGILSPIVLLYSQRKNSWRFANFVTWLLQPTTVGIYRLQKPNRKRPNPFYTPKMTSYGVLICYLTYKILSGTVIYLHTGVFSLFALKWCVYWLAFVLIRWTVKLRRSTYSHVYYTKVVKQNLILGMSLFIISEIMVFFGLFWAYMHSSVNPSFAIGGVWPPVNLVVLEWWRWPAMSTVLLLYSGMTINVFYYNLKTITIVRFLKATNQIARAKASVSGKKLSSTALFVGSNFDKNKIFFYESFTDFMLNVDKKSVFLRRLKKEITNYIERFWKPKPSRLKPKLVGGGWYRYDIRKHYVVEQTHGRAYTRVRSCWGLYWRRKFFNISIQKSWLYSAFIFEYINWKLRFVFGGIHYTLLAGIAFIKCQKYEYSHASFDITDGIYGTLFYSITGLHGLHVIGGVAFILVVYWRFYTLREDFMYDFSPHFGMTASVWYWHFVDVVWFFVYFIIYIWGSLTVIS